MIKEIQRQEENQRDSKEITELLRTGHTAYKVIWANVWSHGIAYQALRELSPLVRDIYGENVRVNIADLPIGDVSLLVFRRTE